VTKKQLQALCRLHNVKFGHGASKPDLIHAISQHFCSTNCRPAVLLLKQRSKSVVVPNPISVLPAEVSVVWRALPTYRFDELEQSLARVGAPNVGPDGQVVDCILSLSTLKRLFDFVSVHPLSNVKVSISSKYTLSSLVAITGLTAAWLLNAFTSVSKFQLRPLFWVNHVECADPGHKLLSELRELLLASPSTYLVQDCVYLFSVQHSPCDSLTRTVLDLEHVEAVQTTASGSFMNQEFPWFAPRALRYQIIDEVQAHLRPARWIAKVCASCDRKVYEDDCQLVDPSSFDLSLLRNDVIPDDLMPSEYSVDVYEGALLCHHGLTSLTTKSPMRLCSPCHGSLVMRNRQPLDAWANFHYYAHNKLPADVLEAFRTASLYELQLVSACRSSNITHLYAEKKHDHGPTPHLPQEAHQGFSLGNVAIMPQDVFEV
jgi:hypothetical protein